MNIHLPPNVLRNRILEKYYSDIEKIGYTDAHIEYHNSMHLLYCKYNPHLKYSRNGKLIPLLNKERFNSKSKLDKFGTPLWVYDLDEEELNSHLTYEEILEQRKLKKKI